MDRLVQHQGILLLVAEQCDLTTVLSLRASSKELDRLIRLYERSIANAISNNVYRSDQYYGTSLASFLPSNITCLKDLEPLRDLEASGRLAAIVVAADQGCHPEVPFHLPGIPANEPFGDALRARVAAGWMKAFELHKIVRQVHRQLEQEHAVGITEWPAASNEARSPTTKSLKNRITSSVRLSRRFALGDVISAVIKSWVMFAARSNWSSQDVVDFQLMTRCLMGKVIGDWTTSQWFKMEGQFLDTRSTPLWNDISADYEEDALSLLKFYLLYRGPFFILELWSAKDERMQLAAAQEVRSQVGALRSKFVSATVCSMSHLRYKLEHMHLARGAAPLHEDETFYSLEFFFWSRHRHSPELYHKDAREDVTLRMDEDWQAWSQRRIRASKKGKWRRT